MSGGGGVRLFDIEIVGEGYTVPRGDGGDFVLNITIEGDKSSSGCAFSFSCGGDGAGGVKCELTFAMAE